MRIIGRMYKVHFSKGSTESFQKQNSKKNSPPRSRKRFEGEENRSFITKQYKDEKI